MSAFAIVYAPAHIRENHPPCAAFMVPERQCLTYLYDLAKHFAPGSVIRLWDDTHTHIGRAIHWEFTCT